MKMEGKERREGEGEEQKGENRKKGDKPSHTSFLQINHCLEAAGPLPDPPLGTSKALFR